MSLRDELKRILPEVLDPDPKDAIKGTELIELVKYKLQQQYSDATLRYHFSIMSCDPSSPIAKVEHGQGYYLRTSTLDAMKSARHLMGPCGQMSNEELMRANKFRALACRLLALNGGFPFPFRETFGEGSTYQRLWEFPDLVDVTWEGVPDEAGVSLSSSETGLRLSFGSPPFSLRAIKLRLGVSHESLREDFFQCLSNSGWAHTRDLVIANPVDDAGIVEELQELGSEHGVGVMTLGLTDKFLDELPEPGAVEAFSDGKAESYNGKLRVYKFCTPKLGGELDWRRIRRLRSGSEEFENLFGWLTACTEAGRAVPYGEHAEAVERVPDEIAGRLAKDE